MSWSFRSRQAPSRGSPLRRSRSQRHSRGTRVHGGQPLRAHAARRDLNQGESASRDDRAVKGIRRAAADQQRLGVCGAEVELGHHDGNYETGRTLPPREQRFAPTTAAELAGTLGRDRLHACERHANVSWTTRVHPRVTTHRQISSVCGSFVASSSRSCPRFPRPNLNDKEGVTLRRRMCVFAASLGANAPAFACVMPSRSHRRSHANAREQRQAELRRQREHAPVAHLELLRRHTG